MRTVLGDVSSIDIENIMIHEHILFDISLPDTNKKNRSEISMKDRWQIDYLSNQNAENARQKNFTIALEELNYFREDGGNLIVDQSVFGLDRDAEGLAKLSKLAGVHIVASAGCYTSPIFLSHFCKKNLKI